MQFKLIVGLLWLVVMLFAVFTGLNGGQRTADAQTVSYLEPKPLAAQPEFSIVCLNKTGVVFRLDQMTWSTYIIEVDFSTEPKFKGTCSVTF